MAAGEEARRDAPPGDRRVIDLAELERTAGGSATDVPRTWTIDLTDAETSPVTPETRPAPPARQRRGLVLGTLAVVTLLVVAAVATVSYRRGNAWRDLALEQRARGEALEQQLREAGRAVADAEEAVGAALAARDAAAAAQEAVAGRLGASEEDVAALEARIAQLASEKARLEDDAAVERQQQRTESAVEAALVGCVRDVRSWLAAAPRGAEAEVWEAWSHEGDGLGTACDAALAGADG